MYLQNGSKHLISFTIRINVQHMLVFKKPTLQRCWLSCPSLLTSILIYLLISLCISLFISHFSRMQK